MAALIEVRDLAKTYRTGFLRRTKVEAVRGISFSVRRGTIVGFVGPNGSGKTTTIKMLLGLIAQTRGEATMFGEKLPSLRARRRLGFLPENPYVYPYLTPRELVEMHGRLSGMRGAALRKRAEQVLDIAGVLYAADRQARALSKGMLQRAALASALVASPELLILDEPMSGLDPVGRKEVRDVILAERAAGRTIFFSTHILSDVEALCDEVVILKRGKVALSGPIGELLGGQVARTEITLAGGDGLAEKLKAAGFEPAGQSNIVVSAGNAKAVRDVLAIALAVEANVIEVAPRREALEDLFMRRTVAD